jgi:lipopolysaccharide biosynthesis glycosyltransferase
MDIVFNVNQLGLVGFGATLTSLLRNCSNSSSLSIWILCSGVNSNDKENIKGLLELEYYEGMLEFVEFDARATFGHLRSLHGDWTGYGRLLIADHVVSDYALYLDADLIVLLDVLNLREFPFNEDILAAVYGCEVSHALDNLFFIQKLNWPEDRGYFNSGVLLFNLKKWRSSNIQAKWKEIAEQYPGELVSHDQTLLNTVCEGKFARLPPVYNVEWLPGAGRPPDIQNSIIHFVGSPKPWDIFGSLIHQGFDTWKAYQVSFWEKKYGKLSLGKIRRTWSIKKSIVRHLHRRIIHR